jgi:biopolymer transport protein ExbB
VFEIIRAGGWLMLPILACSVVALAIIIERAWALRTKKVVPAGMVDQVKTWARQRQLDDSHIKAIEGNSPLGRILAAGLVTRGQSRMVMKESIEDVGRHVVLDLERFMNTLGTIAVISPLLGLLGTVFGMIKVFNAITVHGVGNAGVLSGGISEALITTAAGLSVAIPTLIFNRYFHGKIDLLVVSMEKEALKMVEILQGDREDIE